MQLINGIYLRIIRFFKRFKKIKYACPCCGYQTLNKKSPGSHLICEICFWEDDPVQFEDHDFKGGANKVSLKYAQKNFLLFGASEKKYIKKSRKPNKKDVKDLKFELLEENNLKKIQIKKWTVTVDIEATRKANEKRSSGAEGCSCEDCKWFVLNRDRCLPEEFKSMLNTFGIDYKKDIEITCVDLTPDEKLYGGWYHANGEVILGGDAKIVVVNNVEVFKMKYVPLVPDFEILFSNEDDLAEEAFPRPVFQIGFSAKVKISC